MCCNCSVADRPVQVRCLAVVGDCLWTAGDDLTLKLWCSTDAYDAQQQSANSSVVSLGLNDIPNGGADTASLTPAPDSNYFDTPD
jgi:hypothetical protein